MLLNPVNNSNGVTTNPLLKLQFSIKMLGVDANNISLHQGSEDGTIVPLSDITLLDNNVYTILPQQELLEYTNYYLVINELKSELGDKLSKTVFSFTTGDNTAPTVSLITPNNGSFIRTKLPNISVEFSEVVFDLYDVFSLHEGSVSGPIIPITQAILGDNNIYTFTPTEDLKSDTKYFLVVKGNQVVDSGGNFVPENKFEFYVADIVAPDVSLVTPVNQSEIKNNIPTIKLQFNEKVSGLENAVVLHKDSIDGKEEPITNIIEEQNHIYSFRPVDPLKSETKYFVVLKPDIVKDEAGNFLLGTEFNFSVADIIAPQVRLVEPNEVVLEQNTHPTIKLQFSEAVFDINDGIVLHDGSITGAVIPISEPTESEHHIYSFHALEGLKVGSTYVVEIKGNTIRDAVGNFVVGINFTFSIVDEVPDISLSEPSNGATINKNIPNIKIHFNETVSNVEAAISLHESTIDGALIPISELSKEDDNTYTFHPINKLAANEIYVIAVKGDTIEDTGGNFVLSTSFHFQVGDILEPEVSLINPSNGSDNNDLSLVIEFKFNKEIFNLTQDTINLVSDSGDKIPLLGIVEGENYTYTVTTKNPLNENTIYHFKISDSITDSHGNKLISKEFTFKTGDFTKPEITMLNPTANETNVTHSLILSFRASESINGITKDNIRVYHNNGVIVPIRSIEQDEGIHTYYVTLKNALAPNSRYTFVIDTDKVSDLSGHTAMPFLPSSFITDVERVAPTIRMGGGKVHANHPALYFYFSEPVTVNSSKISLRKWHTRFRTPFTITVINSTSIIITPNNDLQNSTNYDIIFEKYAVKDLNGNFLSSNKSYSFSTAGSFAPFLTGFKCRFLTLSIFCDVYFDRAISYALYQYRYSMSARWHTVRANTPHHITLLFPILDHSKVYLKILSAYSGNRKGDENNFTNISDGSGYILKNTMDVTQTFIKSNVG